MLGAQGRGCFVATLIAVASSCSNFFMDSDPYRISVRTMDLGSGNFDLVVEPRSANNSLGYVSFVPAEGGVMLESFSTGGLNEAGLTCDLQTLKNSQFPRQQAGQTNIGSDRFCAWVLSSHNTVNETKVALKAVNVFEEIASDCHFAIRDAGGESIVVEFIDGMMNVHTDLNDGGETGYGIMTNEPAFDFHLANIKHLQWKRGLTRQSVSVPGSWYPEERFMRIYMVKTGMEAPKSYSQAIMQAVHVLNTVTVPMGDQWGTDSGAKSGEGKGDHTLYGVVYDHIGKKLYWRTTNNQNLQKLDLMQALSKQQKLVLPAVENELPWFNDATNEFKERTK